MKTHYIKAVTPDDLEVIRVLARVVWFAHYPGTIETYKRHGYQIITSVLEAIGSGFYMDDYIMHRDLANDPAIRESQLR